MIEQLHANLQERLALASTTTPEPRAVGWLGADRVLLGARYLEQQDAPPRIVFVPVTERLETPSKRTASDGSAVAKSRRTTFEAHLWGSDFTECELMLEALVAALDAELVSRVEYGIAIYATSDKPGWLTEGELLIVPFTLNTALRATAPAYATITNVIDSGRLNIPTP